MLERAVNILKLDKSLALELFAEGEGGFIYKDLYTLCYHMILEQCIAILL